MAKTVTLEKYQPQVVKGTREFQTLAAVENSEMENVWGDLEFLWQDQWMDTLTEEGCRRWEEMMRIVPKGSDNLEVRRFRIKARINENLPYTYRMLEQSLDTLCGAGNYSVTLYPEEYRMKVLLQLTVKKLFSEVQEMIERMIPANMILEVLLRYNQWQDYAQWTWQQASSYTWQQLREEAL